MLTIYNLKKWVICELFLPYAPLNPMMEKFYITHDNPYSEDISHFLSSYSLDELTNTFIHAYHAHEEWAHKAIQRLNMIGQYFYPSYMNHSILDFLHTHCHKNIICIIQE